MNIDLQIDRLILEGIDLSTSQRTLMQANFESELSRLLAVYGIPQHLEHGGNIPRLLTSVNVTNNVNPRQMGQQIAQSIYKEMQSSLRSINDRPKY